MKVVLVNSITSRGGAALAMARIGDALRDRNIQVCLVTLGYQECRAWPPEPNSANWRPLREIITDRLPLLLYRRQWNRLNSLTFSSAIRRDDASAIINAAKADVVNLHWVNYGLVSPEGLGRIDAPVVWTAHDMWPITGGCHHSDACDRYQQQCGRCPVLGSQSDRDLSSRLMRRKQVAWQGRNIRLVCPSNWLAQSAGRSSLFTKRPISVIPNPIDINMFSPGDKSAARRRLGLPADAALVLFGSAKGLRIKDKGYSFLDQALERLSKLKTAAAKPQLIVVGSDQSDAGLIQSGTVAHFMGSLPQAQIADVYRAADVFVLPSLHENLPNMIAESLACGTPAVAFDIGGISDLIVHQQNGFLARPFDVDDLTDGITYCLDHRNGGLGDAGRCHIERMMAPSVIADRYIDEFTTAIGTRSR